MMETDTLNLTLFTVFATAIVGATVVLIFIRSRDRTRRSSAPSLVIMTGIMTAVLAATAAIVTLYVGNRQLGATASPSPNPASTAIISLSSPSPGAVGPNIRVAGNVRSLPDGSIIWVYLQPRNETSFYPADQPCTAGQAKSGTREFACGEVSFGQFEKGSEVGVYVTTVNSQAVAQLMQSFASDNPSQPISALPTGTSVASVIEVIR